jgi:hypothetical protein
MDNIKIVRLQNGEDIIANYQEDEGEGTVLLTNPMSLMFKRLPTGKAVMLMCPWLPLELIDNVSAKLFSQDILSVFQPREKIIGHYNNTVNDVTQDMLLSYDDDLENFEGDGEEDEEDIEEALEELSTIQSFKKYLH